MTGNKEDNNPEGEQIVRLRYPKGREVIGIVEQRLGGGRMRVNCLDGKSRVCRIPGRMKRHLWVRERNIVIVEPWELGGDEKGDIVYKYNKNQAILLRKKGMLKSLEEEF